MSTPKIAFHGGKCCGIKIIHSLGENPDAPAEELVNSSGSAAANDADQYGHEVSSAKNFYYQAAPEEKYIERVDRYIKYLDAVRPNGIIEITLAQGSPCDCGGCAEPCPPDENQVSVWEPLLLPRGFEQVTSCYNSNSGNRVFVFHRKTDKE
jgi:hypothetical protein